jgi:hypothetical protein
MKACLVRRFWFSRLCGWPTRNRADAKQDSANLFHCANEKLFFQLSRRSQDRLDGWHEDACKS